MYLNIYCNVAIYLKFHNPMVPWYYGTSTTSYIMQHYHAVLSPNPSMISGVVFIHVIWDSIHHFYCVTFID